MSNDTESLQLVTIHGDTIVIEFPADLIEEILEDFSDSSRRQDYWNIGNWSEAKALFRGIQLNQIDMSKVIGTC
jgi:hypothetical protein